MGGAERILVVDDTPHNVKLLADLLRAKGYEVAEADSGAAALAHLEREPVDLVLLDVVMPGMSGYEVCQKIRERSETGLLPVVMVTALDPREERIKGIEAGADDFLTKPINAAELVARVKSLLRIRELHARVGAQAAELADFNATLERRVQDQVQEIGRLQHLKRFLSPQIASAMSRGMEPLEPHRRRVTVVFIDLRGFTPFAESSEPEEMMEMLAEYHGEMGRLLMAYEGTLERFTGDGLMIFFNDPFEVPDPEERAVRMAIDMRDAASQLLGKWARLGHDLSLGIGVSSGYATLGLIGFEGRQDYAAIGSVTNQAARLCDAAKAGQVLVSDRVLQAVEELFLAESMGELELKGLRRPVATHNVLKLR